MDFDFHDLLREAGSNNRHASQRINEIDDTSRRDQHRSMKTLAIQRKAMKEEMRRKAPPPPQPPKFTIPKRKKEEESVNEASVQAFLRRKEQERLNKERQEKEDREQLIKHRMKESGGRASKKIAKHFGLDPLQMQKKYGNDRDHEVALERNIIREQEEHDRLSSEMRSGVYKALAKNKEVLSKTAKTEKQEPFRVGTRKSNSICGLNSRNSKDASYKEPEPYVPSVKKAGDKRKSTDASGVPMKKRPPPPALDFGTLMKQAQENHGTDVLKNPSKLSSAAKQRPEVQEARTKAISRPGEHVTSKPKMSSSSSKSLSSVKSSSASLSQQPRRPEQPSSARRECEGPTSRPSKPPAVPGSKLATATANGKLSSSRSIEGKQKQLPPKVRKKTPPPEPDRAQPNVLVPGKRYLPSDVRYKAAVAAGLVQPAPRSGSTVQSAPRSDRPAPTSAVKAPPRSDRPLGSNRPPATGSSRGASSAQISRKPIGSRDIPNGRPRSPVRHERGYSDMSRSQPVHRRRDYDDRPRGYSSGPPRGPSYGYDRPPSSRFLSNSDEEYGNDYDDEYDSEMDDFIDDTEVDDFQHRELEDTLKMINRNYDKKRWKYNEMRIDERSMEASFRDISREEMYSAKVAMIEDIREAQRGSTAV